nr:tetratricopeptide repeat protein [Xenorhabdus sp. PB30.3]
MEWLLKAAEKNSALAANNIGALYLGGNGIKKDAKKALEWLIKAAEQGDATAQLNLGRIYEQGQIVQHDDEKALFWYQKAQENGAAGVGKKVEILMKKLRK